MGRTRSTELLATLNIISRSPALQLIRFDGHIMLLNLLLQVLFSYTHIYTKELINKDLVHNIKNNVVYFMNKRFLGNKEFLH